MAHERARPGTDAGRLVQQVIQALPPEQRKGYLFTPQAVLTLQGLVDRILDADGITAEVREAQRAKAALLQQFFTADDAELAELVKEHDSELDYAFFDMLTARPRRPPPTATKPPRGKCWRCGAN